MDSTSPTTPEQPQFSPMDISIVDQNSSLNAMVAFLNLAQRRGAFSMDESAKVWEAVKFFIIPNDPKSAMPTVSEDSELDNTLEPAADSTSA
tara:strand:- start:1416 stop:1691 length:276 start_codon:yes stop_codon:yes gene_type:complete